MQLLSTKRKLGRLMRNSLGLTLIVGFSIGLLSNRSGGNNLPPKIWSNATQSDSCPLQTPEEWQQFLEHYADNKKWVETCEDSACDHEYYEYVKENIQDTFEVCTNFLRRHKDIERCTSNLRRFTPAWMQQHSNDSYGFIVDNHTYLSAQDSEDKPGGMMQPPSAIVAALPDLNKVEEAARKGGFKYLTHDSALGGFRTFVLVSDPKDRFDLWMLLNLQKGQTSIEEGTPLSIATVQKADRNGKRLPHVRLHFRDYTLNRLANGYKLTLNEEGNGKCYSCHVGGMRQLIARRTPILDAKPVRGESNFKEEDPGPGSPDFSFSRLMELNRRIRSYGAPDWTGQINPEDHGPTLGKAQGCTDCHDGKSRGALRPTFSHVQLSQKVLSELSMPPDTSLPKWIERKEVRNPELSNRELHNLEKAYDVHRNLVQDFEESRFPALKKWFLETPCLSE